MKVGEVMTTDVLTIGPEAELRDVARLFVEHGITGVPVCGAQREILGVISEGDILFKEQGPAEEGQSLLARLDRSASRAAERAAAIKVGDAMSAPAMTVSPFYSVAEAARIMSEHGINRLPVVKGDELVGIVTRTDLVRAFVRSDEDIRREIRQEVLRDILWLEAPAAIGVDVDRGVVRLNGHMETSSDASLLVRLVGRVPGVVSVLADLSWTTDDTTRKGKRTLRRTQMHASSR
ncbi:MAG: domain containing rane protein [Gaiellaceae bacterium]|jgi:CBS domain-containing protein|nr:domain containing rane protein [Gaiellaceae bacterium]